MGDRRADHGADRGTDRHILALARIGEGRDDRAADHRAFGCAGAALGHQGAGHRAGRSADQNRVDTTTSRFDANRAKSRRADIAGTCVAARRRIGADDGAAAVRFDIADRQSALRAIGVDMGFRAGGGIIDHDLGGIIFLRVAAGVFRPRRVHGFGSGNGRTGRADQPTAEDEAGKEPSGRLHEFPQNMVNKP